MRTILLLCGLWIFGGSYSQSKATTSAVIEIFAGSEFQGTIDGQGTRTMFSDPQALVLSGAGPIYCWQSDAIRVISSNATVTTLPFVNGFCCSTPRILIGPGGILLQQVGSDVLKAQPLTKVLDDAPGPVQWNPITSEYVASEATKFYHRTNGAFALLAGSGNQRQIDGDGAFSSINSVSVYAVDPIGNIVFFDCPGKIRRVTPGGVLTTVATSETTTCEAMACSAAGTVFYSSGGTIRFLSTDGEGGVLVGDGLFRQIGGLAVNSDGDLFFSVPDAWRIYRIRSASPTQSPAPAQSSISLFAGVTITGILGRFYRVESAPAADGPWSAESSLQLPQSPFTWIDQKAVAGPRKFYRVLGL